jgi:hypothetical protein
MAEIFKFESVDRFFTRRALGEPYPPYTFYRRNPLYCGLWIYYCSQVPSS